MKRSDYGWIALTVALAMGSTFGACSGSKPEEGAAPSTTSAESRESPVASPREDVSESPEESLRGAARSVAGALRDRDFEALASWVGAEGVRFSPYSYVEPEAHVTLSAEELRAVGEGAAGVRTWGFHDGSGEPIEMTVPEYFDRFVYDVPYLEEGELAVDERQGTGSSLDNAEDVYPDGRIVEYHVPGRDPRYGGMDWRSLRLVFEEGDDGRWRLVGVIHDEWTI